MNRQARELAQTIANHAQALASETNTAPDMAVASLTKGNLETLIAWIKADLA